MLIRSSKRNSALSAINHQVVKTDCAGDIEILILIIISMQIGIQLLSVCTFPVKKVVLESSAISS